MAEPDFQAACARLGIPENLRKLIGPDAPSKGKIAVARGVLPAPPRALLHMSFVLLGDADPAVRAEAESGLLALPADRVEGLIDGDTHPKLLEFLAYRRTSDLRLMERVALQRQANDKTLCFLAEVGTERVAEIVANNQERLVITPSILRFLERNPQISRAIVERVRSFQRLYEIELPEPGPEELEAAHAAQRARGGRDSGAAGRGDPAAPPQPAPSSTAPPPRSAQPAAPAAAPVAARPSAPAGAGPAAPPRPVTAPDRADGDVTVPAPPSFVPPSPPGLINPLAALCAAWGIEVRPEHIAPPLGYRPPTDVVGPPILPLAAETRASIDVDAVALSAMTSLAGTDFTFSLADDADEFGGHLTDESLEADDAMKADLAKQIREMSIGQKIKLAYKGNKPVREILVRDRNKLVSTAVVRSGRITDNEVHSIASNRSVHEDVIRALCDNKEYLRKYPVKLALVGNPKTPVPIAIGFLGQLHAKDLRLVSTNRNVSSAVFGQATKLYKLKKQGGD